MRRLAQAFNPKYQLANELAGMIMMAALSLECIYLRGRPFTTRFLRRLHNFTQFAQRVYPREASLQSTVDWLGFSVWLESGEPFSTVRPLIAREENQSRRSDLVKTAFQCLLLSGRDTEAREACEWWCALAEEWWQQTKPLPPMNWLPYKMGRWWIKAQTQHDLDESRNRGREALTGDLAILNRQEKRRLLQAERNLARPLRPRSGQNDFSSPLAKAYRESHLLRALLQWSAQHGDEPLAQLRTKEGPQRMGTRCYSVPPTMDTAFRMGMSRAHYLSLVKKLTQDVRRETALLTSEEIQPGGSPLAAPP